MRNARLDEGQAGIKISGRNINNLRYADDTTLKAESQEELKVKEESEKADLTLNIEKTISLNIRTCFSEVMSLLFKMLSRLVITFLPRSKCLLISWLQSPSTVILEPKKIKSVTVSIVSPSISHEMMELDALILVS